METYTCVRCRSCHVEFNLLQGQRDHFKSDWHRCNAMRKVADLPPLSKETFSKIIGQIKSQQMQQAEKQIDNCELSKESFNNQKGLDNQDKSKNSLDILVENAQGTIEENLNMKNGQMTAAMQVILVNKDIMEVEEVGNNEREGEVIPTNDCLICCHRSSTLEINLHHMNTSHYFKLELEYCTDVEELVEYLGEKCQISDKDNKASLEILLKKCQEYEWDEVSQLLKHSTDYGKEVLTKALMIAKTDSQWNIIKEILMCDVFDKDVILFVFKEAVLENQHDLIALLGNIYDVDVFPQALLFCEGKGNWEMIMTILNISLDIDESVLNKVLISASHHQQWHIVKKVLQSDVEFSDTALEKVLDCANLNGKLDLIEDIIKRYSHIISDKVLLQATIHQQWKFIFIVLKSLREFRKETLADVFREAFMNMDTDIMQYFFTQNYNGELIDFDTLTAVYGKICFNKQELAKKVALLLDTKVKSIIYPFKMTTAQNPLGSIWSHNLDGNIQITEICKHSVADYCRLERSGCPRLHTTENFHWQISFTGNYWINLTKNQSQCIEEAFCNPCIDHCYPFSNFQFSILSMQEKGIVTLLGHENWVVDFKYNLITNHLTRGNKSDIKHVKNIFIRRLEVKNSEADQYQWYFKENNDIWVKYGNRGTLQETADITSNAIEQFHSKMLEVSTDLRFYNFTTRRNAYCLDFHKMEQTNKTTGMKRLVKRRPNRHLILSLCHPIKIKKLDRPSLLVRVDIPTGEYKEIFEKLNHTIKSEGIFGSRIESVEKVNNSYLKRAFKLRLEMIERNNADFCQIYNKKVWHGTKKEFVENIIRENFDWRLYGKSNGKVFGEGVYFTPEPKYAIDYATPDCDGKRYLIISSIIVGFMTVGHKNMEKPPVNPVTNIPYDTSVNNLVSPSIYVKYNKQEYCPEYIVTIRYKKICK